MENFECVGSNAHGMFFAFSVSDLPVNNNKSWLRGGKIMIKLVDIN